MLLHRLYTNFNCHCRSAATLPSDVGALAIDRIVCCALFASPDASLSMFDFNYRRPLPCTFTHCCFRSVHLMYVTYWTVRRRTNSPSITSRTGQLAQVLVITRRRRISGNRGKTALPYIW